MFFFNLHLQVTKTVWKKGSLCHGDGIWRSFTVRETRDGETDRIMKMLGHEESELMLLFVLWDFWQKKLCVGCFFVHNLFGGHEKCYGFDVGAWLEKSFRNGQHIFVDWMLKSLGDQRDQQGTGYVAAEGSHKIGGCMGVLDFPNQTNSKCCW